MMTARPPLRLAVLISGGGRTLLNLQEHIERGDLAAQIDRVVSSRSDAPGVARSRAAGLRVEVVERRGLDADDYQDALTAAVGEVDLVCMAGFLSLWVIPSGYAGRVINIHPALLPAFGGRGMYGHHVHEAVLAAGCRESGCTVHYCDNEYDRGPIILQRRVPVLPGDTPDALAARVFEQECVAYPEAISLIGQGHVRWEDGRVIIRR